MSEPPMTPPGTDLDDVEIEDLPPAARNLVRALLLYKSVFIGPWFTAVGLEEDRETKAAYEAITEDTRKQAYKAVDLIRRWSEHSQHAVEADVTTQVLTQLLSDLLALKKSSTEAFLGAGMRSPTEELRREFLDLARMDREHADTLRGMLGIRTTHDGAPGARDDGKPQLQPQVGPFPPGTLSRTIADALERSREAGFDPARLVISSECLRHLRDEGAVEPRRGDVFDVPVEVDFAWSGEAFAVSSKDRLSLAEIVTQPRGSDASPEATEVSDDAR